MIQSILLKYFPQFYLHLCVPVHLVLCNVITCVYLCIYHHCQDRMVLSNMCPLFCSLITYSLYLLTPTPTSISPGCHTYFYNQVLLIVTTIDFNIITDVVSVLNKFNINLHKICTDFKHKENYNIGVTEM